MLYVTHDTNNKLRMQGQFAGQCPSALPTLNDSYTMPTTFSTDLQLLNIRTSVKLSADSRTISFMDAENMACRYKALRQSSVALKATKWLSAVLLSGLMGIQRR